MSKKDLSPEVREYFRKIGKERGLALKEKYGSDYFRRIAAKRKTFGRKPVKDSVQSLAKKYGFSRTRAYVILNRYGVDFNKEDYETIGEWRDAVLSWFVDKRKNN